MLRQFHNLLTYPQKVCVLDSKFNEDIHSLKDDLQIGSQYCRPGISSV